MVALTKEHKAELRMRKAIAEGKEYKARGKNKEKYETLLRELAAEQAHVKDETPTATEDTQVVTENPQICTTLKRKLCIACDQPCTGERCRSCEKNRESFE